MYYALFFLGTSNIKKVQKYLFNDEYFVIFWYILQIMAPGSLYSTYLGILRILTGAIVRPCHSQLVKKVRPKLPYFLGKIKWGRKG